MGNLLQIVAMGGVALLGLYGITRFFGKGMPDGIRKVDTADGTFYAVKWKDDVESVRNQLAFMAKVLDVGDPYLLDAGDGRVFPSTWQMQGETEGGKYLDQGYGGGSGGIDGLFGTIERIVNKIGATLPIILVLLLMVLAYLAARRRK